MRLKRVKAKMISAVALGALSLGTVAVWAAAGSRLMMNGNVASTKVRIIDGQAYVPISDVAKAQGMVVVPISGGYEIKKAGGATPIAGLQGKVGDEMFDGKWKFQVLSVQEVPSHRMQFDSATDYAIWNPVAEFEDGVFQPKRGRKLIAVKCRVTNGRNNGTHALWIANSDTRTALADLDGESHPPIAYDLDESEPFQSKALLPGAKTDFTVLFSVPASTRMKDLVFTLRTINNNDNGNDARVSLQ